MGNHRNPLGLELVHLLIEPISDPTLTNLFWTFELGDAAKFAG